ncbi:MAG: helix-turn-helix transcriptional regulator [Gemmatimonadetes bacterium]|nr:helix-turn-helix transcriptional regulator [Gemmatimonadota bacterium]
MSRGEAQYTRSGSRVRLNPAPVRAFLEERGISQNELARLAGISPG